jgi:hypothetical protein
MSGGGDETPVEQEYHLEEKREQNAMDSKYPVPKFSAEHLIPQGRPSTIRRVFKV